MDEGGFAQAAEATAGLMRRGVPGIYQGVLIDGDRLARPDLLERIEGSSALGPWLYRPGDVKSALSPRSDAVLQVTFAAILLERTQGVRPASGFLVLGDGTRRELDLGGVRASTEGALSRVEAIVTGDVDTLPFLSTACGRCRWRGTCIPEMAAAHDASLVPGLTPTLLRALRRHGIRTVEDLAGANARDLAARGAPVDGLERLALQARALVEGRVLRRASVDLPRGTRREHYLRIDSDPLGLGAPFRIAWGSGWAGGGDLDVVEVRVAGSDEARLEALGALLDVLEARGTPAEPVFVFGSSTPRAFDRLGDSAGIEPGRLGDLEGRLVDLAPRVRRAAYLPVSRYRFEEVAAIVTGAPRPDPGSPDDDAFVEFAALQADGDPSRLETLRSEGRRGVEGLRAIRRWLGTGKAA